MKYDEWLLSVPTELTGDPLWRNEAYRLALFAGDIAWADASKLAQDSRTRSLSDQLLRAVGSVGANIAEGYSRSSGKDEARLLEYALGSAREARHWTTRRCHGLSNNVVVLPNDQRNTHQREASLWDAPRLSRTNCEE